MYRLPRIGDSTYEYSFKSSHGFIYEHRRSMFLLE